ncbi:hypothetical protein ZIOFF_072986 [Zingiber officinale]|uniref:Leucine-rich repeat-containing N-terminal plant-type domain-containing protein n=1 Tax=Zingiber officinale TaxID=94328 RepID=A0A8J5C6F2_ZINOF|nr:hypothetical protein ZIOFF_072986 [Zingiber officinale]
MAALSEPLRFLLFFFLLCDSPVYAGKCHKGDKKVLLSIKNSIGDYIFTGWTSDFACCDWSGVGCDEVSNRVTALDVGQTNTTFSLPAAVSDLPFLTSLSFHKNPGLVGPIPAAIGTMVGLTFLRLDWNSLSGPHPPTLTPSIRNRLTGPLPPGIFSNTSGAYLRLSHNGLSGEVPPSYGAVEFLQVDLSRNRFTGDASFLFGRGKGTQQIDLSRNVFEFDLGKVEFPEAELIALDLNHNKIYGSIPKQIAEVENLQLFNVSYNRLCGEIPTGGRLDRFDQYCYLHNKCLCGAPLPPCK